MLFLRCVSEDITVPCANSPDNRLALQWEANETFLFVFDLQPCKYRFPSAAFAFLNRPQHRTTIESQFRWWSEFCSNTVAFVWSPHLLPTPYFCISQSPHSSVAQNHRWQELLSSHCPSSLQCWFYRFKLVLYYLLHHMLRISHLTAARMHHATPV